MALDIGRRQLQRKVLAARGDGHRLPSVVIVGAGLSGLALAIQLVRSGMRNFTIVEQSDGVGGTWRDNSYPGSGCDVPSHLYSFSFAPKTDWTRRFAEQPEILSYAEQCVHRYRLDPPPPAPDHRAGRHPRRDRRPVAAGPGLGRPGQRSSKRIRSSSPAASSTDRTSPVWTGWIRSPVRCGTRPGGTTAATWPAGGSPSSGTGPAPSSSCHRWPSEAAELTVYQRSPNYVAPKKDRAYSAPTRWLFESVTWSSGPTGGGSTGASSPLALVPQGQLGRAQARPGSSPRRFARTWCPTACPRSAVVPDYPARLQAHPDLERLVPGSGPAQRQVVDRSHRPRRAGRHRDHRRAAAPGRRDHLRHRLRHHRLPGPHPGHRRRRSRRWPTSGRTAPMPTSAWPSPASPTAICCTGPIPTSATTRSCSWWKVRSTSSCRPWPSSTSHPARRNPGGNRRPGDGDSRRLPTGRRRTQRLMATTAWVANCTSWYKTASGRVTNNWPTWTVRYWYDTLRLRSADHRDPARAPLPSLRPTPAAGPNPVPVRSRCARRGWCPAVRPGSPRTPGPPRPGCSSRRVRRRRPAHGWVVRPE